MASKNSEASILELVTSGYGAYQRFANDGQYIPGFDGLKKVQRRYLMAVKSQAKSKFQKTALILGWAMGNLHPHAVSEETMNTLVRWGLVEGQGNFGMTSTYENIVGAAMRYTEIKYNSDLDNLLFKFEKYCPMDEGELGTPEPKFLITVIPIALLRGCIGIGVGGVCCKIPAFTYTSLLNAYIKDDPTYLRSAYGLEIDFEKSQLTKLWNEGSGKLVLKFKVERLEGGGVVLSGDATPCKPNLKQLLEWESEGWIAINDESTQKMRIVFSRNKGIRKISDEQIYEAVSQAAVVDNQAANYLIMFSHNGSATRMGIKGWLDLTIDLYKTTHKKWQELEITKLEHQKKILRLIPKIVTMLRKEMTSEEIAAEIDETVNVVKQIEAKPLKFLRGIDVEALINKLDEKIKEIKASQVNDLIKSGAIFDKLLGKY